MASANKTQPEMLERARQIPDGELNGKTLRSAVNGGDHGRIAQVQLARAIETGDASAVRRDELPPELKAAVQLPDLGEEALASLDGASANDLQSKARYVRGLDTGDPALVRAMLADDCVLDFRGCWTDPTTGEDLLPQMNVVMRGAASWSAEGFGALGVVSQHTSVHHLYSSEFTFGNDTTADVLWSMTARLFMPPGGPYALLTGYSYYHETYEKTGSDWKLKAMRVSSLRAEGV